MPDSGWWAALAAAGLVLAGAALARWRRAGEWPGMAIPLALLVALTLLLGGILASPRQLGERLPMLALLLGGPALLASAWPHRWVARVALGLAALLAGWWMAGGGLTAAQPWPVLAAVALAALLPAPALARPWQGPLLAAGLAVLLLASAPPGPWAQAALLIALVAAASAAFGPVLPLAGRVALAPLLVAVAAGPVIALARAADLGVAALLAVAALLGMLPGWPARAGQAALFALGAAALLLWSKI